MPKVSVVIITYNQGQFIAEAIQSVLDQTLRDLEIIVIDDGSTDNTREVVSPFPVTYFHQENQGVCKAYNRGAALSTGEYIYFLDADDVALKDALEKEVKVLDSHPEVAFSYGQAYVMTEQGHVYRVRKSSILNSSAIVDGKEQIRELLFINRITSSTVLLRRRCFEEVGGFDERMGAISEDRHLYVRLCKRYPVAYIAEPLIKYRVHPEQTHKKVTYPVFEEAFSLILQEVFDDPAFSPEFQRLKKPAYSYTYRRVARYAYGKDMRVARNYMRKAFTVYPRIALQGEGLSLAYRYATSLLPDIMWQAADQLKKRFWDSKRVSE